MIQYVFFFFYYNIKHQLGQKPIITATRQKRVLFLLLKGVVQQVRLGQASRLQGVCLLSTVY